MTRTQFTTESGAVYVYDSRESKIMRFGPRADIKYEDAAWHPVTEVAQVAVGYRALIEWPDGGVRITTPVTEVEEIE